MSDRAGLSEAEVGRLLKAAGNARKHAYAPYSGFAVGAAVLATSGSIFTGCNVENASYGLTVCAERVAILNAVSEGETRIAAVAIVAEGNPPAVPCGACLQVMVEFGGRETLIVCAAPDGSRATYSLGDLLPKPFKLRADG